MRRVSKKRAALDRSLRPARQAFVIANPRCWVCGGQTVGVHEMACGMSIRSASIADPATWFAACGVCNTGPLTDYAVWPLFRQLALKWIHDRRRFDLRAFNLVRGRAPGAIVMAEVIPFICRELDRA